MTTTPNSVITPQTLNANASTNGFTNANGTGALTVFTAGTNGSVLSGLNVYSTDTATGTMTLNLVISAVSYPIVTTQIAIQSGNITGTPPVNLLSAAILPSLPRDAYGNPVLNIPAGATLTAAMSVAPTTGKIFSVVPINPMDL